MPDRTEATLASPDQDFAPLIAKVHTLSEAGSFGEALALVSAELSRHPSDCELLFARATVLFDWGRILEARAGFLQAEANGLARIALDLNLAWTCHLLHLPDEAERYARKAIALDPSSVAAHFGLGTVLQRQKRYPEALACYERTLELSPGYAQGAAGIAHCKLELHEYVGAEEWMRRAVELAPDNSQFWINLGVAIANQERYTEALDVFKRAEQLESAQGAPRESAIEAGFALITTGGNRAATELYRDNLPDLPDPRAHGLYAYLLLAEGQLREGWSQYEFRWMHDPHLSKRPNYPQPTWAGQHLAGKTILLLMEQGVGDIIHFARYAVPLKAMGATVVLQARPELMQLAQGFAGVDHVFTPPTQPPHFDYYIHLMSIPHVLGTELATVPADVPYVRVDPDRSQRWAARMDGRKLNIGIAWAGNPLFPRDRFRSIPLDALSALWEQQGVRFFSLQKPLKPGELEKFPTQTTLVDLAPELQDFADTAAAISQLDLVICVDTAIAHLAGALGKPVWLMLPDVGDFRWLEGREDSPWYPTMRLFRQRQLGEWDDVVARIKDALQAVAKTGSLAAPTASARARGQSAGVVGSRSLQEETSAAPKSIARVTETRYGIMQYFPDVDMAARSIAWYGEFLQPQLDIIAQLLPHGAQVIEVGSGIGAHALPLAKMVGPDGQLFLFETRSVVQRVLRQNLEVNQAARRVTIMRRGLAGPCGVARENTDLASGIAEPGPQPQPGRSTETLDELLLERLDLLKVRSSEAVADIVDGASATLWRLRPTLCVDAPNSMAVADLAARLREFGYRCWQMETPFFNPDNFNRRDTDIFDAEKALALLAIPEEVDATIALDGCIELTDADDPCDVSTNRETATDPNAPPNATATVESNRPGLIGRLRKLLR